MKQMKSFKDKLLPPAFIFFLAVFLVCCGMLANWYLQYCHQEKQRQELADLYGSSERREQLEKSPDKALKARPDKLEALREINEDCVGWIAISGTDIDYPVVYRDNSYYLTHDFYGEKDRHGAVFLDAGCGEDDFYCLMHAHNMKDGTMFADLKKYRKEDFVKKDGRIFFETLQACREYRAVCTALVDLTKEDFFHYEKAPESEEELEEYREDLRKNAIWFDEDGLAALRLEGSHMLVMSTCEYGTADERLIVVAVSDELQEESKDENKEE